MRGRANRRQSAAWRRPGASRVLAAAVLAAGLLLSGCGESRARQDAREGLVEQLTADGDISTELARCVVDRFFSVRSDDELEQFFDAPDATPEELDEFARLTRECSADLVAG